MVLYTPFSIIRCTRWIYWEGNNTSLGKRAAFMLPACFPLAHVLFLHSLYFYSHQLPFLTFFISDIPATVKYFATNVTQNAEVCVTSSVSHDQIVVYFADIVLYKDITLLLQMIMQVQVKSKLTI